MIKHDFSTSDLCGRWGFEMGDAMTADGWAFADRSRTTAEIIIDHYRSIREAAGDDVVVLGCNTIGHLSAGIFEISRVGDDTSGQEWARTRKMGVNTLAFRLPQHGAFLPRMPIAPAKRRPLGCKRKGASRGRRTASGSIYWPTAERRCSFPSNAAR